MDFTFSESQQAIADLAGTILAERCPPEVLRELERTDERTATDAWKALAGADLLGLWLPEESGGSGLGLVEACLVAERVGRHVALVPYWTSKLAAAADRPLRQRRPAAALAARGDRRDRSPGGRPVGARQRDRVRPGRRRLRPAGGGRRRRGRQQRGRARRWRLRRARGRLPRGDRRRKQRG
jgi:Acyl-CoA dehydrogenase, N-terminal domain